MSYVFGYANFIDGSARGVVPPTNVFYQMKSRDTFAPIGPYIVTADEIKDPHKRPHADSRLRADPRGGGGDRINAVLAAAGYNFILLLRGRNTLSSGMLTTRFLFPKFFPKKFGQKIGAV